MGNAFFGLNAGAANTTGSDNAFIGNDAGRANTTGNFNTFVGLTAGSANTTGEENAFFGSRAGINNTTGSSNTTIGRQADVGSGNLDHATAIGADATVSASNTIALGRSDGSDKVVVYGLGFAGNMQLCRNSSNQIASCSSSSRYKTNLAPFRAGLSFIDQLRPITFEWKTDGAKDVGFGAEDVARVNPLLVTYNAKGEVEGVKYDRLSVLFVNAFKEQQAQIKQQQQEVDTLKKWQQEFQALKALVCADHPAATACKSN